VRVRDRRPLDASRDLLNVFVYGTLLSGEPNHDRLRGARLIASTRTESRYTLLSLGPYPALVEGGTTSVAGEVYDVDDELLRALDRFEGVPSLYRRVRIHLLGGSVADGYALPRSRSASGKKHRLIPGGDWREYRRGSPR
jgi:gamma-glutamylcyclotransferase (GGCT)/AIG2-like uncharacterized protein YtfP